MSLPRNTDLTGRGRNLTKTTDQHYMARLCNNRGVTLPSLNCAIFIFFVNIYSKIDGRRERTRNTELRPGVFLWVVGFRGPPARSGRSFGKGGDYPGKSGGNRSFAPQQLPGRGMARLIQPGWGKVLDETPAVHHHDAVAAALQYPDRKSTRLNSSHLR